MILHTYIAHGPDEGQGKLGVCGKRVSARYPHYLLTYNDDTGTSHEVNR